MDTPHIELCERIQAFALDEPGAALPFSARLAKENGWSHAYAKRVIEEYKRFAFLAMAAGHVVSPSEDVDQAWHMHMTYTRSYWNEFCEKVLQKPLHHNPTQGGEAEHQKYFDLYNRTLESYHKFFSEAPPSDIWPDAATRFSADEMNFQRVNLKENWVIPKAKLEQLARRFMTQAAFAVGLLLVTVGCAPVVANIITPLDMDGPTFLAFYTGLAIICFIAAFIVRDKLRKPSELDSAEPELSPYEIAYLSEGTSRAVMAAVTDLIQDGALRVEDGTNNLMVTDQVYRATDTFANAVLAAVRKGYADSSKTLQTYIDGHVEIMRNRLIRRGLIPSERDVWVTRLAPSTIMFVVVLLGVAKIHLGNMRNRPVGYLWLLMFAVAFVAFVFLVHTVSRTRRADKLLQKLQIKHKKLSNWGTRTRHGLEQPLLPNASLAVALFGITALQGHPTFSEYHDVVNKTHSGSGGCGGGGCGGGGCGGGCGGCGGCGGD